MINLPTKNLPRIHRLVGLGTVLLFLLIGLYMRLRFPDLYEANETIRFLFRASHIYLLLAGLLNLGVGIYLVMHTVPRKRMLQGIGSALLLIAPVVLLVAFFVEPPHASPERLLTLIGVVCMLAGTFFHYPSRKINR